LSDQCGVDFIRHPAKTDHAIASDLALFLEEKHIIHVEVMRRHAHVGRTLGPHISGRVVIKALVRPLVIFAFDKGPEGAIQRLDGVEGRRLQVRKKHEPNRAKPALHFAFARRLIRPCVDKCGAQLGANQRQMLRAKGRAIVDV
jgi:hypothetical protein